MSSKTSTADEKDLIFTQLDDMFEKVAFENAAMQTDFKHTFSDQKVVSASKLPNPNSSPYLTVLCEDDKIAIDQDSFHFLNGKSQGQYESQ